jgi:cytochrome c6
MNHFAARIRWMVLAFALVAVPLLLATRARAEDGGSLFKTHCAVCHGTDGSGDTAVGKSLKLRDMRSADVQKMTDAELTAIITNGKGGMPSYKDKLSGAQIKDLVGYIRELGKKK